MPAFDKAWLAFPETLMLHTRSFVIGALCAIAAMLCVGISRQQSGVPRYQISTMGQNLIVLATQTNQVSLLYRQRVDGLKPHDWPWAIENSFSLGDALRKKAGASIQPGIGR